MAKTTKTKKATAEKGTGASKATPARKTSSRSGTTARAHAATAKSTTATRTTRRAPARDPLLKKAEEVEGLLEFVDSTSFAGDEREVADELAAVDQHPADMAGTTLNREIDYTIKQVLEDDERQIQAAMRRKQAGTYGICANCGQKIPRARLAARPEATLCITCQRLLEGSRV